MMQIRSALTQILEKHFSPINDHFFETMNREAALDDLEALIVALLNADLITEEEKDDA